MAMYLTGSDNPIEISLASLLANLPELLGAMMKEGSRTLAVIDFPDFRYVQFWAENEMLIGEVISNENIPVEALNAEQEHQLREAGWDEPGDFSPNWSFTITNRAGLGQMIAMMNYAMLSILKQGSSPELQSATIKTFKNVGHPGQGMMEARETSRLHVIEEWDLEDDETSDLDGPDR